MPAAPQTEPLPPPLYRSEAFAEDLLDAEQEPPPRTSAGALRRAAAAARRGGRGLYGWLRRPATRVRLAT